MAITIQRVPAAIPPGSLVLDPVLNFLEDLDERELTTAACLSDARFRHGSRRRNWLLIGQNSPEQLADAIV